jgi:transposase
MHDFRLFKESKVILNLGTNIVADTGYQGIQKLNFNSTIPIKKKRNIPLTEEQKEFNHKHSSKRIAVENVFALLKRFRILGDKYRNRRRRFGLRFNLIAGLHNYELGDF